MHRHASPEWSGPQTKAVTSHRTPKTPTRPKGIPPLAVVLIEKREQMRRREFADLAADCGTHHGAVAPVHAAPYTRVTFLGMNLVDAGVVTNRAGIAPECQWELISIEPHRVEPQHARSDRGVSRGIFGVGRRDDEGCPPRIGFGLGVAIGVAGTDGSNRAPEHVRVLRIPGGDQRVR